MPTIVEHKPIVLTVIMPCFREGDTVGGVINALQSALVDLEHEVLVIYDDPQDNTLPVIQGLQNVYPQLCPLKNDGKGVSKAVHTGIAKAQGRYIVFLVADDPGPVPMIKAMIDLMDSGYDLVGLTRYARGGKYLGGSGLARALSFGGNRLFYLLTRFELTDTTCGIKMFRKSILDKIILESQAGWTIVFELVVKAYCHDLKMTELPFTMYNRINGGPSRFRTVTRVFSYIKVFCWGVTKIWEKKFRG